MERADRAKNVSADRALTVLMLMSAVSAVIGFSAFLWSEADIGSVHPGLQAAFVSGALFGSLYVLRWHRDRYGW